MTVVKVTATEPDILVNTEVISLTVSVEPWSACAPAGKRVGDGEVLVEKEEEVMKAVENVDD